MDRERRISLGEALKLPSDQCELSVALEIDHIKTAEKGRLILPKINQLRYDGSTNQNQENPAEGFDFFA